MIITNAFSLQMLDLDTDTEKVITIKPIDLNQVIDMHLAQGLVKGAGIESAIGHADTAAVLSDLLGFDVPMNRISITLKDNEPIIVAQLVGGRLPEGSTTLPEGFKFKFLLVHTSPSVN